MEPCCAREDCQGRQLEWRVRCGETVLAYACQPSHFREFMYATRHLGAARVVERLKDDACGSM